MIETTTTNYKKKLLLLIALTVVLKCILASSIEFGNDEVYYWTYAKHLQWSYFDHPPLIAIFIRLFTFNLNFNSELFVRLTSITGAAINTWLVFKIITNLKNEQSGWYAALLYSACIYSTFISGFLIIPDSPQVVFWLLGIYLLIKIFVLQQKANTNIVWFGFIVGITTLCKVHGVYLWCAAGLFILCFDRKQLLNLYLYLSVFITLIIISPIFIWNYQNDFITYNYQGGRVTINQGINPSSFGTELVGEILYVNPAIFILILLTFTRVIKRKLFNPANRLFWLFMFLSLPLIAVLWSVSLFRDTLPHWSGPAYISLLLFTAYYVEDCFKTKNIQQFLNAANTLVLVAIIVACLSINFLPLSLGKQDDQHLGDGDFTMDLYGWRSFENDFKKLKLQDVQYGIVDSNAAIISNKWFPAAHLDYYVATPLHMKLYAFGPLFDIHNFAWLNNQNGKLKKGDDAYYISPSNYSSTPDSSLIKSFSKIEAPVLIHQFRNKVPVRNFNVYRLKNFK